MHGNITLMSFKKIHTVKSLYKTHFSMQLDCWSLRCSWSIACRRCSNYIFILNLTPGFNGLGKDNYKMIREAFKFWDLVRLILETLRYVYFLCFLRNISACESIHIQYMVTSRHGNAFHIAGPLWGESTSHSPHKGSVIWNFIFSLSLAWTSCWTKSWVFGDLRCHDVHVMTRWWVKDTDSFIFVGMFQLISFFAK